MPIPAAGVHARAWRTVGFSPRRRTKIRGHENHEVCHQTASFLFVRFKQTASPRGAIAGGWHVLYVRALAIVVISLMGGAASFAYSVLTHEEIADLLWTDEIQPLLFKQYPRLWKTRSGRRMPTPTEAPSSRISATTRSAAGISATCCITFAAETPFASCCSKARMSTSTSLCGAPCRALRRISPATRRSPALTITSSVASGVAMCSASLAKPFGKAERPEEKESPGESNQLGR